MNTRWLSLALVAASLSPLGAQAQQALIPAQSEVAFTSRQMGVPVDGKFKTFSAQVAFDPAKLATSQIAFTVDTGSADISREANAELPKATWFNVAAFPKATFTSSSIKRLDANKFEVTGKLSIKGVSSDVVMPVTLAQNGATTTATGAFPIKRLTFRIGEKEWADTSMVADEVQVKFKIALTGVNKL
ncbi:YceI family protein [Hydrogenophaga sp. A37]|uniref:YceI family protein n=1 Tax=Hydrogenophaga sp. A37 TaxID=1945864 RepID=UPI000986F81B|nr:YceI family protein [Hydrogenophaga sp. A37]OOG83264.1 polyisoprenoid-binding protein [Hydrogenophaga sp. A37]